MTGRQLTELHIDGKPMPYCAAALLVVEVERIEVTSGFGRTVPDSRWTYLDPAGHWHAAATRTTDGRTSVWYPTLEEHREPNPEYDQALAEYDEYDEPRWFTWMRCLICQQRVDPRTITSHEREYVAGHPQWRIEVDVADVLWWRDNLGTLYTVRGLARMAPSQQHSTPRNREWFGVARWHPRSMRDAGGEATMVSGTFEGVSELGERVG